MFHFVYVTTNLVNGKQYVGDHSTNNLNDGYLGSGTLLKKAIKKYGKDNFLCEIKEFFDSKEGAFFAQHSLIDENKSLVPNGYNLSPTGGIGVPGSFHSQETKDKIGKAHKGKEGKQFKTYNTEFKKGKSYEEQMILIYGEEKGIKKALLYKEKISNTVAGNGNPMYGKGYKISGQKNGRYGKPGTRLGVKLSEETKRKMSLAAKKRWKNKK